MAEGENIRNNVSGYSGTPLAKKLGIKPNCCLMVVNQPLYYSRLFTDMPDGVCICNEDDSKKDVIHFFTKSEQEYEAKLPLFKEQIKANGSIWVSWPKKASKIATDLTENSIRNYALSISLVDIKVCAVDEYGRA